MSRSHTQFVPERQRTSSIPDEEYHRLLASERRRHLLDALAADPTVADLETAAEAVAERETGSTPAPPDAVDEIAITLHHAHLPKLADAGVLEYDPATHVIDA